MTTRRLTFAPPVAGFQPTRTRKPRPAPPCTCPACRAELRTEPGFCEPYRAFLARIKAEMDASHRQRTKRHDGRTPECCTPECRNPRAMGEKFCRECAAESWTENDIE